MPQAVRLFRFPTLDYAPALRWQRDAAERVRDGASEALALLQHTPVYTFGSRIRPEHLLVDAETLRTRGAGVVESDRGGDITFHGPGQLVAYPILDLHRRGLGPTEYVRALEEVIIVAMAGFGLHAERRPGRPGVWTGAAKIAAIGVRLQHGVTTHGFALNVDVDLAWFDAIVPCGLRDAGVTSMHRELGHSPGFDAVSGAVEAAFERVLDCALAPATTPEAIAVG